MALSTESPELPLVSSVDDLSADWLTIALGRSDRHGRVVSLRHEAIGDGKIGSNHRLFLEWSPPGSGPATVVSKMPSTDPSSRATGVGLGIYVREARFYSELAATIGARAPYCHAVRFDEASGDFVLVLEDLAPAVQGDQLRGCTRLEAAAAMAELDLLHASHWAKPVPEFVPPGLPCNADQIQVFYSAIVEPFCERYRDRLADDVLATVRRFGDEMSAWGRLASAGPWTLLHGDFRLDNLLFGGGRVGVVDWQVVATGPAMFDVAYFLGAGLLPKDRRLHEIDLLRAYHARLAASGAIGEWSFDECLAGYRLNSLGGIIMAVIAATMVGADERSDEMFCVMAERHATHAVDCEAFSLLD
jgi:hypothetical protein